MMILVNVVAAVALGVFVYQWVAAHNAEVVAREDDEAALRTLDQGTAAVITAIFPIFGLPYVGYRMHGNFGILLGLGIWIGYFLFTIALGIAFALIASAALG